MTYEQMMVFMIKVICRALWSILSVQLQVPHGLNMNMLQF